MTFGAFLCFCVHSKYLGARLFFQFVQEDFATGGLHHFETDRSSACMMQENGIGSYDHG